MHILPRNPHRPRETYNEAYEAILRDRRTNPTSSVVLLVPPDLDALCAARILSTLFKRDDVNFRTIPVAGYPDLTRARDFLFEQLPQKQLLNIIFLNAGGTIDLLDPEEWFADFPSYVTLHVIDSARPCNLHNLFGEPGPSGPRVVVWDDGHSTNLKKEKEAFDANEYGWLSDEEDEESDPGEEDEDEDEEDYEDSDGSGKRRRSSGSPGPQPKRSKKDSNTMSKKERRKHRRVISKYYNTGTHRGQSCAGIVYVLCTIRQCADNDLLWFAILGLTHQYLSASITRAQYVHYHTLFSDEVARLNPPLLSTAKGRGDDAGVRPSTEFRFALLHQWTLYDSMIHSGYVANKLGTWKEGGVKKLRKMLTKMGLSIQQSQQAYNYMDLSLRQKLPEELRNWAPESGLLELDYESFTKGYGNEMPRTSAADVLMGVGALLEAARGVKLTVEVEGSKGGGEIFGSERLWGMGGKEVVKIEGGETMDADGDYLIDGQKSWNVNFWIAYDALTDTSYLRKSIPLAISLQRAIVRQGCSILEKKEIDYKSAFRWIKITQGPDLALFANPATLTRLVLWLVEATRDRIPKIPLLRVGRTKKMAYPYVVACLNERTNTYVVVGVAGAPEMDQVRNNVFSEAFIVAKQESNARSRHATFETNVIEIHADDLENFVVTLQYALEGRTADSDSEEDEEDEEETAGGDGDEDEDRMRRRRRVNE